tara:strand:- start:2086 stop:2256 length:171 start_codon:yes stop_codon:yes gene_type:complete
MYQDIIEAIHIEKTQWLMDMKSLLDLRKQINISYCEDDGLLHESICQELKTRWRNG